MNIWCLPPFTEHFSINSFSAGPVYKRDPHLAITVFVDAPAPTGTRPSTGKMLTTKLETFRSKFRRNHAFYFYFYHQITPFKMAE